jgi:long-subunit fatty acid transport protein
MFVSTIESKMKGFNALFGLSMRKPGRYQIGFTYRTPTSYEIEETFSDEGTSYFDDGSSYTNGYTNGTTYTVVTPASFSAGMSFNLFRWFTLVGDAEYTDWREVEFDTNNPDLLQENRYIKRTFRQTTNLRGGVELTFWDWGIALRGGMAYLPSPYKDDPTSYDKTYITGGVGIELDRNTMFNVSVARGTWSSFRDNYYVNGLGKTSSTSERVTSTKIYATIAYRF